MNDRHVLVGRAIYNALVGDPDVASLVGTYNDGPAIFFGSFPSDAPLPRVVVQGPVNVFTDDHLDGRRRDELSFDVLALDEMTGSDARILALTDAIRNALHAKYLMVPGGTVRRQTVRGPQPFTDDRLWAGRLLDVSVLITW
jgi:hypothetical protein